MVHIIIKPRLNENVTNIYKPVMERRRQRAQSAYKRERALPEVIQAAGNGVQIQIHKRSFPLLGRLHSQFTGE